MSNTLIISLALISGLATFIGVFLGVKYNRAKGNIAFGAAFAASIMILISIFELIPQGYKNIGLGNTVLFLIIGIVSIWLISILIPHIHSFKELEKCDDKCLLKASYLVLIGLLLHDFPEGFAIADSFKLNTNLGLVVFISTLLHNIPEGYTLAVASSSYGKPIFYYRSALLSGLATFSGAILAVLLLGRFSHLNNYLIIVTAGIMLFISLHELFPLAERFKSGKLLSLGVTASVIIYFGLIIIF